MNKVWTAGLLVLAVSCGGSPETRPSSPPTGPDPARWALTEGEKAWVEAKRTAGGLKAASSETPGGFSAVSDPQHPTGYQADLVRGLGEFLNLPVSFVPVSFDTYFSRDGKLEEGVKTGTLPGYEPDVFRLADLAAFNFSALAWRTKLMDLVPVFPTRLVLVTRKGNEIRQLSDLSHRTIAVFANTSHEQLMKKLQSDLGLEFTVLSVPYETNLFTLIREGKADAMVRDVNGVMLLLPKNPEFTVSLPIAPTEMLHWAISKQNPVLSSLVAKYLDKARSTGELADYWLKSNGISYADYTALIGDDPPLVWTPQDQAVLAELAKTGLRAAIDAEQTIYEPQADGSARGVTYNLLLETAKRLGVPLKLRKTAFREYFDRSGQFPAAVKTDAGFTYRPDLLDQTDVYADTFSPLDWRKKFLAFVSLYPSRLVWVGLKGGVTGPGPGKTVAVLANSSYQDWIKSGTVVAPGDLILTASGDEAVKLVVAGKAALTVSDANLALGWLGKYPGVTFFPADAGTQDLSWAVDKNRSGLKALLDKVLESIRHSGTFSAIWQGYYRVSFDEYLGLLAMESP